MNHYPRHIGDYLRDTVGLTASEEGMYSRLMDQYYSREEPLPLARVDVYRMARARSAMDRKDVDYVLRTYFTEEADGWHQKRCDREIEKFHGKSAAAAESARLSWVKRNADAMRSHMPTHSDGNASRKPVTSNHKVQGQELGASAPPKPEKRRQRLPDDWAIPGDWMAWAHNEKPELSAPEIHRISLTFRDYWLGKGDARADWQATWRNWIRKERNRAWTPTKPSLAERRADNMADIMGRKNGRTIDAGSVDRAPVLAALRYVREPDGLDVGGLSEIGIDGGLVRSVG